MATNKEKIWYRKCPKCGNEIFYVRKFCKDRAEKRNTNCILCIRGSEKYKQRMRESKKGCVVWNKGIPRTEEEKQNISNSLKGENHPFYGKKRPEHSKRMSGENHPMYGRFGDNNPNFGSKRSEKTKRKMRLSRFNKIKEKFGVKFPNHNPVGCEIINWYNMYYGFNFQHAENGGEVCIDGYWPDGLDEKRKTIIEIDEKKHFDKEGNLRSKDIQRQEYLEDLGYKFIRIKI